MNQFADVYSGRRVPMAGQFGFKDSRSAIWLQHPGAYVTDFRERVPAQSAMFGFPDLDNNVDYRTCDFYNPAQRSGRGRDVR